MNETTSTTAAIRRRSPEETFALLGDDTRIAILRAMGEAPEDALSFSALRERVGTEDSGQFNYHLRKLVGSFVRKAADGYELTYAGRQIVGAMHAGTYTANATVDSLPVDGACPFCGAAIEASYADETVSTSCTSCGEWFNEFSFPPGSLDQFDGAALPLAFDRWMLHVVDGVLAGFCHTCAGRMTGRVVVGDAEDGAFAGQPAHLEFACGRCGDRVRTGGATPVTMHPAVEGFLYEHGLDVHRQPSWAVWQDVPVPSVDVVSHDPPRLRVVVAHEGERVVATVESDATVSDLRREPVGD
ncbi:helix-turn-helix transcriptional regulator [Halorubellus sp. JP-L1]|uniref:winged helix-turn-helix domain-containing protein n=1 Tax=Halorubellus sp. JP-L1 TaxID=2715753 RepID=UPI00140C6C59|nr:helix-turn-helix domain-containing protein [Halorubellus sp. JP-L1]NHN40660.1 helix-turn-helix transcriptional regulator [Halorubellus sp. JP-L1]